MKWEDIKTLEELKIAKSKFYGNDGELKKLQMQIRTAPNEMKSKIGAAITKMKNEAEEKFTLIMSKIEDAKIEATIRKERIDVTAPMVKQGTEHLLTKVSSRFREWFIRNGYFEEKGSEIELDEYNFGRLNIDKNHPARDMQDTLYIDDERVMRTHNTGFSARALEENANKAFSHFVIGKVYRNDEDDQTHTHQFTQADLVSVGKLSFPNLIWTLKSLLSYVLEQEVEIRLRPSYFPFTEPSVEVDVFFNGRWIEVLGAGMVHHAVLEKAGYTNDMNAIAAGIGIERIAMIKYGVDDIREFYKNDLRFINQFKEVL